MKDFMYIIRGGDENMTDMSPEEMEKHMADWGKWMGSLAEQGNLVGGEPLQKEGKTLIEKGNKVIDRPLVEGKEMVGGYLIMKANDLAHATELAQNCPGLEHDCTIEVRAIQSMN